MSKAQNHATPGNIKFAKSIVQKLDVLSVKRKEWEATDYKKANEGLYAILASCLEVLQEHFVKGNDEDRKAVRGNLMQRLQADGIRVVKTTTTPTMLARFVFNSDRKRAQGYGYVLTAAVSHSVSAADFPTWVVNQGGIEEIKRLMVKKPAALAKQAAVKAATAEVKGGLELAALQPLARVNLEGLTGTYAVLLAKPNPAGGVDIVGSLPEANDALVNALILRMAKQLVNKAEQDKELGQQVNKADGDLLANADEQEQQVAMAA